MDGVVKGQRVTRPQLEAARELRGRQTGAEQHLWQYLRAHRLDGHHFRRQQPIGPYIVDFFCAASHLVVEVDGAIHEDQLEYDRERDNYLAAHNLRVLRFRNDIVLGSTESVLASIRLALSIVPPSPSQGGGSSPQRRGGVSP
jgi:very-short-patch-repair endonuclease